jgi:hypothetical protein
MNMKGLLTMHVIIALQFVICGTLVLLNYFDMALISRLWFVMLILQFLSGTWLYNGGTLHPILAFSIWCIFYFSAVGFGIYDLVTCGFSSNLFGNINFIFFAVAQPIYVLFIYRCGKEPEEPPNPCPPDCRRPLDNDKMDAVTCSLSDIEMNIRGVEYAKFLQDTGFETGSLLKKVNVHNEDGTISEKQLVDLERLSEFPFPPNGALFIPVK